MKNKVLITTFGALTLLTGGCVSMEKQQQIDQDLLFLKDRINTIEQGIFSQNQSRESLERQRIEQFDGMAKRQADLRASQEALHVEMQAVRGLLDNASARRREEQETLILGQKDAALRLSSLDSRLTKVEKDLQVLLLPPTGTGTGAANPELPSAETLYEQGRGLILNKVDIGKGRTTLEEFIRTQPQSELLPNAYYWIAEAFYAEKNFENAIVQFQDVIEKYPSHPKASAALYKQSLSFEALGEGKKAAALLKKLIEVYPDSDEAKLAREKSGEKPKN